MAWTKGITSVGGKTSGEMLEATPSVWTGYSVGDNTYSGFAWSGRAPFSLFINFIDWSGPSQQSDILYALIECKVNGTLDHYIAIKYSYEKGVNLQGRMFLSMSVEIGTMDLNNNYTVIHTVGQEGVTHAGSGIFPFKARMYFCYGTQNNRQVFGIAFELQDTISSDYYARGLLTTENFVQGFSSSDSSFSPEFGKSSKKQGGYNKTSPVKGSFDDHSDTIIATRFPDIGVSTSGFINMYQLDSTCLEELGAELFPPPLDILSATINRNLTDCIICCRALPCHLNATGSTGLKLKVGWKSIDVTGDIRRVTSDYKEVDLGSISIPEYWCNFLDFTACRAKLFLPFYGFVDVPPEYWNGEGAELAVKYRICAADGSFVAFLYASSSKSELSNSLVGQYSGRCSLDIPITGQQMGDLYLKMAGNLVMAGFQDLMGNGLGALSSIGNIASLKPNYPMSNGYQGNSAFFGHRRPYLLIERADAQFSENYPSEVGLPLEMQGYLRDYTGMTVASHAHLDHIPCTKEEKEMISQMLSEGVIL